MKLEDRLLVESTQIDQAAIEQAFAQPLPEGQANNDEFYAALDEVAERAANDPAFHEAIRTYVNFAETAVPSEPLENPAVMDKKIESDSPVPAPMSSTTTSNPRTRGSRRVVREQQTVVDTAKTPVNEPPAGETTAQTDESDATSTETSDDTPPTPTTTTLLASMTRGFSTGKLTLEQKEDLLTRIQGIKSDPRSGRWLNSDGEQLEDNTAVVEARGLRRKLKKDIRDEKADIAWKQKPVAGEWDASQMIGDTQGAAEKKETGTNKSDALYRLAAAGAITLARAWADRKLAAPARSEESDKVTNRKRIAKAVARLGLNAVVETTPESIRKEYERATALLMQQEALQAIENNESLVGRRWTNNDGSTAQVLAYAVSKELLNATEESKIPRKYIVERSERSMDGTINKESASRLIFTEEQLKKYFLKTLRPEDTATEDTKH